MTEQTMTGPAVGDVLAEIAAERRRQVEVEGFGAGHDDLYVDGELAAAAAVYTLHDSAWERKLIAPIRMFWPWSYAWWKPTDRRRNLVKAAALLVAEIERLDRAAAAETGGRS